MEMAGDVAFAGRRKDVEARDRARLPERRSEDHLCTGEGPKIRKNGGGQSAGLSGAAVTLS